MIALLFALSTIAFAAPDGPCAALFYLREMEKPFPVQGLLNELDLLGFLLPKTAVAVRAEPAKPELGPVDRIRFSLHKPEDRWNSSYVRLKYLAGAETVRQLEFKNWKDRGLPSEARARSHASGRWTATTSALFDEGVPHHHLRLEYSPTGDLEEVVVTTREPGRPVDVTRFVPHAPRDAR